MTRGGWPTYSTTCLRGLFRPLKRLRVLNAYSTYSITLPSLGGVSRLIGLHPLLEGFRKTSQPAQKEHAW